MAGTKMGYIKKKLGMKGKTKAGEMISKMNKMKYGSASGMGRLEKVKKVSKKSVIKKTI